MRLKDKVCVITGAGHGFGADFARAFVEEGAKVALNDINADALAAVVAKLGEDNAIAKVGDAASREVAEGLVAEAADRWGSIDVMVNNVGVVAFYDPTDLTEEQWNQTINVNLKSHWLWTAAALQHMLLQKRGSVIFQSSISAFMGQQFDGKSSFLYNITKAGALQMARSFATRYGADNIRFNALAPGHFPTEIVRRFWETEEAWNAMYEGVSEVIPLGRPGRVEELSAAAVFLASDESSYMTGQMLAIDGGILVQHP